MKSISEIRDEVKAKVNNMITSACQEEGATVSPDEKMQYQLNVYSQMIGLSLAALSMKTGRNTIAYYSGFEFVLSDATSICDADMIGFMTTVQQLDPAKGLDLILHTPGGDPTAAEGIVNYLHQYFGNNIRVIVPQMAFSAGTMISCSASTILMGPYSCLGPIDPQIISSKFGPLAAHDIMQEFTAAKKDIRKDPAYVPYWQFRLQDYPTGFFFYLKDAVSLSAKLVGDWLEQYMFAGEPSETAHPKAQAIVKQLNGNNYSHGRHFSYTFCKELGLNVELLGQDPELESLILQLHFLYCDILQLSQAAKIIENQNGSIFQI